MITRIQQLSRETIYSPEPTPDLAKQASSYISAGVACHALLFLHKLGLIDRLINESYIETGELEIKKTDQLMLQTALSELEVNGILHRTDERYSLTKFGENLTKYIGLIYYIYDGYSKIFSNFFNTKGKEQEKNPFSSLINDEAVVIGSDSLGEKFINPLIIRSLLDLNLDKKGVICDLGCGDCSRLLIISKITKLDGVGIEISDNAISLSKQLIRNNKGIRVEKDDISSLGKSYPDVTLLLQTMVMHDFTPVEFCAQIMRSYINKFPNMQYFFYCDVVAPSSRIKSQLPGFDYIHSMLNIKTRTYQETIDMFGLSGFEIIFEKAVAELPNILLWVLKPKKIK